MWVYKSRLLATFKQLGRNDSGQALAEYAILLAVVAGVGRLESLAPSLFADYPTALLVGAGIAVALVFRIATSPRNRF